MTLKIEKVGCTCDVSNIEKKELENSVDTCKKLLKRFKHLNVNLKEALESFEKKW